jgi:hypothetical protein
LTGVSIDGNAATATSATSATTAGSVTNGVYTNASNTFTTGTQIIATGADGTVGFRIKRNSATQTANLLEVTQSDGTTILAKIDSAGAITTSGNITVTGGGGSIQTTGLASYISANAYIQTPQFVAGASAAATPGTILINGASSGTATLNVPTTAGGTHTFPATGGTVVNSGTTTLPAGITSIPNVTTANGLTSASSLATVGTIGSGTWQGTAITPTYGGTGQSYGAALVGRATLSADRTKASTSITPEDVFWNAGGTAVQYFNLDPDTLYSFDGYVQVTKDGTSAYPRAKLTYFSTSTSVLTPQAIACEITTRTNTTLIGVIDLTSDNTPVNSNGNASTFSTFHHNFSGFIRTHATTAGRFNIALALSVMAGTAPVFKAGSTISLYKHGTGNAVNFGNWTA